MKKIIRLTESDLTRLVRRVIKEQQSLKPIFSGAEMQKSIKSNGFRGIQDAVKYCKSKRIDKNPKFNKIEEMIYQSVSGVENPLNITGGSPGLEKVGQILSRYISNTNDLCSLIANFYVNGEDFETLMKGEINTKMDSTGAADHILKVIYNINRKS